MLSPMRLPMRLPMLFFVRLPMLLPMRLPMRLPRSPCFSQMERETIHASTSQLIEWWLARDLTPHVCARAPLSDAFDAITMVNERRSTGKVVLVPE